MLENLEQRQMLSGDPLLGFFDGEFSTDDAVVASQTSSESSLTAFNKQEFVSQQEFVIVGGDSKDLFSVTTIFDSEQNPIAVLSLTEEAKASGELQHEIILELQKGQFGVSRHQVVVTLAGDLFLAAYRQDRLANAQAQLPAVSPEKSLEYLSMVTKEGEFSDLTPFGPQNITAEPTIQAEVDRLGAITESLTSQKITLDSIEQKTRLYSVLDLVSQKLENFEFEEKVAEQERLEKVNARGTEKTADSLSFQEILDRASQEEAPVKKKTISRAEQKEVREQFGKIAIQMASQIQSDLASSDPTVAATAERARDSFVENANFSDLLWKGYGVNSRIAQESDPDTGAIKYSVIYEAGQVQLSGQVKIDVGQPAFIEVTETPLNQSFSAGRFAANAGVTAGAVSNVGSEADTYVFNTAPDATFGGTANLVYSGHSTVLNIDGYYRFDISAFSQYTSNATVELTPDYWQGSSVDQAAEVVDDLWEEATTSWNTRPADNPASPVSTTAGNTTWTVNQNITTAISLDVSAQVRAKLRQGDVNFDSIKGNTGTLGDITADINAFEMVIKDPAAFDAAFGTLESDASDLLDRADLDGSGSIDVDDAEKFFALHGLLQGDRDLDGDLDGAGFLEWQLTLGNVATYFEGDVDFSGTVDGGDLDIWSANFGLTAPDAAEEKLSLRIFAPSPQPAILEYVGYGAKEHSVPTVRPSLEVEQDPNIVLGEFDTTFDTATGGNLQVTYNVLNEALNSFDIEVYRSADGITPDANGLLMTHTVSATPQLQPGLAQQVSFQANFAGSDVDEDYYLVAKLVGTTASAGQINSEVISFTGGAFQETDRTVHIHGTDDADTIEVLDSLAPAVNFATQPLLSYGGTGQDITPSNNEILNQGDTLRIWGNTWKAIDIEYNITSNTILEFDFESTDQGEIHGIGFDTNLSLSSNQTFQLQGTQTWGVQDYNNYAPANGKQHYQIPVGQHFTGNFNYLLFANDHDVSSPTGESIFSNVRIYEAPSKVYVRAHGGDDIVLGDDSSTVTNFLFGGADDDILRGGSGANYLYGSDGNDESIVPARNLGEYDAIQFLYEGAGDDTYTFEAGLKGFTVIIPEAAGLPAGNDTLNFSQLELGINNLDLGITNNTVNSNLTLYIVDATGGNGPSDIENVIGTDFDDVITGNALDNRLEGGTGEDTLYGEAGNDTLIGGAGNDGLYGGTGSDTYDGGAGIDAADDPDISDIDTDGLSNTDEVIWGTDATDPDTDNDGLTDGWEVDNNNPGVPDGPLDPTNPDSDGDGTPDGQEDPDGDGATNEEEQAGGTDPNDPGAIPVNPGEWRTYGEASFLNNVLTVGQAGKLESDTQISGFHGGSLALEPADSYTFVFDVDLSTWDSYNPDTGDEHTGFWDLFSISVTSLPYDTLQLADDPLEFRFVWGGTSYEDDNLENFTQDTLVLTFDGDGENAKYLNLVLDTFNPPDADGIYPSWGTFTLPQLVVDIDTDSNNTGQIGDTVGGVPEDDIEASEAGKRIFVNTDDDNKNGKVDTLDDKSVYAAGSGFSDKDFAEIKLDWSPKGEAAYAGFELWIGASAGLNIWKDPMKTALSGGTSKDGGYAWQIDSNGKAGFIDSEGKLGFADPLYIEGTGTGAQTVTWELRTPGGKQTISEDVVNFSVEAIVWPFEDYTDFTQTSTAWDGLAVGAAWWTEKTLIDYITAPGEKGEIATVHPDLPNERGTEKSDDDSLSTKTYDQQNVTLEFDYEFDRRGGNEFGYVQADLTVSNNVTNDDRRVNPGSSEDTDRVKLSFVSNSGIKFGGNKEVAIFDVEKMIELAGGIDNFTMDATAPRGPKGIDNNGKVDIMNDVFGQTHDFEDENLSQLMSGVLYNGDYTKMNDFQPNDPTTPVSQDYIDTLMRNAARQQAVNHMEIIFSGTALSVKINGQPVYFDPLADLKLGQFNVQSHWDSGVKFSKMKVIQNGS